MKIYGTDYEITGFERQKASPKEIMKTPLTDKLRLDSGYMADSETTCKALFLAGKLEEIAREALQSFECTQTPSDYSEGHWSRRLKDLKI